MIKRARVKTIPIKPSRSYLRGLEQGYVGSFAWTKAPPFVANPRGVLIHRVRHVSTILYGKKEHHHHAEYLCGNGCNFDLDSVDDVLVADPPSDRLLCDACEARAVRKKLPTGDALAGRHVHRGILIPQQVCCQPKCSKPRP